MKKEVELSHLDKILFPKSKIRKRELIDYYSRIAGKMFPYLEDRPAALKRFVDGIGKEGFYQKNVGDYFPFWIKRVRVKKKDGFVEQIVINNKESLIYLVNQDAIEFHLFLSNLKNLERPDKIIFDLDADAGKFNILREVAFILRRELEEVGAKSYVMTTGSKGLHVVVPIKQNISFDEAQEFARRIALKVNNKMGNKTTLEQRKNKREGRVFIDILRNSYAQLAISPYSVRAREGASVAMPISWRELDKIGSAQEFNIFNSLKRKDAWKDFGKKRFNLKNNGELLRSLAIIN